MVEHWNRLPKKVMESLPLEVFKEKSKCGTQEHGSVDNIGGRWMVGLDDF